MSVTARTDSERVNVELFKPLVLRKAVDEVVSVLVDAIHGGLVEPGARFPREVDLAAQLDVSRNTVSHAFARLEKAGVVAIRRGSGGGATVINHSIPPDLLISTQGREVAEITQFFQARRPVETQATVLAARRIGKRELRELRRLVEMLPGLVDDDRQFMAVDLRFHAELGRMSGNVLLAEYLDDMLRRFLVLRTQYPVGNLRLDQGIANQWRSFHTLEDGDEAAILDAVDDHLGSVEEHFLGSRLPRWQPTARSPG